MDPLVSIEDLERYLQRTVNPEQARLALAGASGMVRHFCRWVISAEDTTFVVDGRGTDLVSLPTLRLTAVEEVRVDGRVLTTENYQWSRNGQLRLDGLWPRRFRAIEVEAQHGYAADEIPDEITAVVFALSTRYYVNPEGLRSKTVGAVSRTFVLESMKGDLTELETALIGGHRLP